MPSQAELAKLYLQKGNSSVTNQGNVAGEYISSSNSTGRVLKESSAPASVTENIRAARELDLKQQQEERDRQDKLQREHRQLASLKGISVLHKEKNIPNILVPFKMVWLQKPGTSEMVVMDSVEDGVFKGKLGQISYNQDVDRVDSCNITINDPGFAIMNNVKLFKYFYQGQGIVVALGWKHGYKSVIAGRILKVEPNGDSSGNTSFVLYAYDDRILYKWDASATTLYTNDAPVQLRQIIESLTNSASKVALQTTVINSYLSGGLADLGITNIVGLPRNRTVTASEIPIDKLEDLTYWYNLVGGEAAYKNVIQHIKPNNMTHLSFLALGFAAMGITPIIKNNELAAAGMGGNQTVSHVLRYPNDIAQFNISLEDMAGYTPIMKTTFDKNTMTADNAAWINDALYKLNGANPVAKDIVLNRDTGERVTQ